MAKRKKSSTATDPLAELLDNPEIIKALLKIMEAKKKSEPELEPEEDEHTSSVVVNKEAKIKKQRKMKFIDVPEVGIAEGKWDKKYYEGYQPTERRQPFKPINVTCAGCGKNEKISEQLYSSEHSYYCGKCTSKSKGRSAGE